MTLAKPKRVRESNRALPFHTTYDEKGRLKETVSYRNNGEIINKGVYSYDGNKLEKSWFDANGKLYSKIVDVLDDKSNVIEHTFISLKSNNSDSKYIYSYDSFDEQGNWTKKTSKLVIDEGKEIDKL